MNEVSGRMKWLLVVLFNLITVIAFLSNKKKVKVRRTTLVVQRFKDKPQDL